MDACHGHFTQVQRIRFILRWLFHIKGWVSASQEVAKLLRDKVTGLKVLGTVLLLKNWRKSKKY